MKKCEICGFDRMVDRCHIVPRHILKNLRGYRRYALFTNSESKNILYLCRNHHSLFDLFRLNREEWEIILPKILKMREVMFEILNSDLEHIKETRNILEKRKQVNRKNAFERWKYKIGSVLVSLGVYNYYGQKEKLQQMF